MSEHGKFNEATRVQMPALVHLTRLGYNYYGKISEESVGKIYDGDTNILLEVFKSQFEKLNPDHAGEYCKSSSAQVQANTCNESDRQGNADRAIATPFRTRANRYNVAVCNGKAK